MMCQNQKNVLLPFRASVANTPTGYSFVHYVNILYVDCFFFLLHLFPYKQTCRSGVSILLFCITEAEQHLWHQFGRSPRFDEA